MKDIDACNLLRRCLAGRRAADWQEFIDHHGAEVRRAVQQAAARTGLPLAGSDLDEMVQDFYCRLLSVRGQSSPEGGQVEDIPEGGRVEHVPEGGRVERIPGGEQSESLPGEGQAGGFRGRTAEELWHYMIRVAHSLVVDRLRRLGAGKRIPNGMLRSADPSRLRSPKLDPEERLLKKECRKIFLKRCLEIVRCDRVRLELRALTMALLGGWSSREIAHELQGGLSVDRVDRLVCLLRRRLNRDGIRMPRRYCVSVSASTC